VYARVYKVIRALHNACSAEDGWVQLCRYTAVTSPRLDEEMIHEVRAACMLIWLQDLGRGHTVHEECFARQRRPELQLPQRAFTPHSLIEEACS
jgi:hypothetical protein